MKYNGRLLYIAIGSTPVKIVGEKNSTFTLSMNAVAGAGSARSSKHHAANKSWSIQTQVLLSYSDFATLFNSMRNGTTPYIRFQTPMSNSRYRYFKGECVITRLSFAGQGKGLVSLNISAIGAGKPTTYIR